MTTAIEDACYVFGIVPADARLPMLDADGLGVSVRLVGCGDLAAIVATRPGDDALGTAADLLAHDRVLAAVAVSGIPVLPMRFGAVLTGEEAVLSELLEPHHDEFIAALNRIDGCLQYAVTVRYEQDALLREILAGNAALRRLQDSAQGESEAAFHAKIQLGSAIVAALSERRPADEVAALSGITNWVDVRTHEPASPDVVVQSSFLVRSDDIEDFERSVESVGRAHAGRLRVRLVGPSPAYDFVEGG